MFDLSCILTNFLLGADNWEPPWTDQIEKNDNQDSPILNNTASLVNDPHAYRSDPVDENLFYQWPSGSPVSFVFKTKCGTTIVYHLREEFREAA